MSDPTIDAVGQVENPEVTPWELPNLFSAPASRSSRTTRSTRTAPPVASEHDKGYESGFALGKQEGLNAGAAAVEQKLAEIDSLLAGLAEPLANMDSQIARELIQLSVKLAETIIHREVGMQPELVEKQVAEALAALTTRRTNISSNMMESQISVRLHPDDAKILTSHRASTADDTQSDQDLSATTEYVIVPDAKLHRGGCILQTPHTLVDATIEKQLKDLLQLMFDNVSEQ